MKYSSTNACAIEAATEAMVSSLMKTEADIQALDIIVGCQLAEVDALIVAVCQSIPRTDEIKKGLH